MSKIVPNKKIQKQRTEQEMRMSLVRFQDRNQVVSNPSQVDDDDTVLGDVIEELLEKREIMEQIRGFVVVWSEKLMRR